MLTLEFPIEATLNFWNSVLLLCLIILVNITIRKRLLSFYLTNQFSAYEYY